MFRPLLRPAALALLGLSFAGCGGDSPAAPPPTPPTPTASIAIGAATATIVAGATTPVTVTLTRGGGFTGAVSVTAGGLPTGVTASTETIAAGASTATVTLTAVGTAPATTAAAVTVTGSGNGVTIAPQALALSVTPAAGASIAVAPSAGTVAAGTNGTVTVTLTRVGGFTGNVVVAATALPTGVTVASQTISGAATTATLTLVSATTAAAATTSLSITGTATGVTIAPQTYALTITAPIAQIGTDITNLELGFGSAMALSADGTRLVVAANGSLNGTTRVYQRSGTAWTQLGSDVVGEAAGDFSGTGVDINAAGTRIAVGAYTNSGNGNSAGHVRVFDLVGSTWTQVGADIDGNLVFVSFGSGLGWRVALSASGNRLIAGAPIRNALGGFARVYDLIGGNWTQVGADLTGTNEFGDDVDISSDGSTVAVSSPFVPSSGGPGSVQVFRLSGANWAQVGNVLTGITTTPGIAEIFGDAISLSANGARIAVGAPIIVAGAPGGFRGQVRVFDLVGSTWTQVGSSVTGMDLGGTGDKFGSDLMLSDDGTRFAASARETARGRVFTLTAGAWVQTGADIRSTGGSDSEGIALSPDGKTVAIGSTNGRRVSVFSITP